MQTQRPAVYTQKKQLQANNILAGIERTHTQEHTRMDAHIWRLILQLLGSRGTECPQQLCIPLNVRIRGEGGKLWARWQVAGTAKSGHDGDVSMLLQYKLIRCKSLSSLANMLIIITGVGGLWKCSAECRQFFQISWLAHCDTSDDFE